MPNLANIVVYSAELCSDCQHLKAWMDLAGIAYENRDIRKEPAHGKILEEKIGKLAVPYVIINGEWKKGYQPGRAFSESFARELFGV